MGGGRDQEFYFFWGHKAEADGKPGRGCLSQFWPAGFTVDGVWYRTAEHWMMAGKARLFKDEPALARILAAREPLDAKRLGRKVRGFREEAWAQERLGLVVRGNLVKFRQHPDLRAVLMATGERVLVEASPRDRVWGIGMGASNPLAKDPKMWRGLNLLGSALTQVREILRQEEQQQQRQPEEEEEEEKKLKGDEEQGDEKKLKGDEEQEEEKGQQRRAASSRTSTRSRNRRIRS